MSFLCLLVILGGADSHAEIFYDNRRTAKLNQLDIAVIRYANHDVMENIEGVFCDLQERILRAEKLADVCG